MTKSETNAAQRNRPNAFTPLHRWLGLEATPISIELLDAAVDASLPEAADLDFKAAPPRSKDLASSDLAKDIAAMANSGGGVIVFGVRDEGSKAVEASGIDDDFVSDAYVRDLRRLALNKVTPPVLNAIPVPFSDDGRNGLMLLVPGSEEAPHLLFHQDSFRGPYRNGPDTAWMSERMLEAAYRARFSSRARRDQQTHELIEHQLAARDTESRVWIGAAALPAHGVSPTKRSAKSQASNVLQAALSRAKKWTAHGFHPLEDLDIWNLRSGMRGWVARAGYETNEQRRWKDGQAQVFDDGSVTFVAAMGGGRSGAESVFAGNEVASNRLETFVADLMALMKESADQCAVSSMLLRIDLGWDGEEPIRFRIPHRSFGDYLDASFSVPFGKFMPVEALVDLTKSEDDLLDHVREVALDVVNQGGAEYLHALNG